MFANFFIDISFSMQQNQLDDIYINAYNNTVTHLNDFWHTKYASRSSNTDSVQ